MELKQRDKIIELIRASQQLCEYCRYWNSSIKYCSFMISDPSAKCKLNEDIADQILQLFQPICPECKGEGGIYPEGKPTFYDPSKPTYPCPTCNGTGEVQLKLKEIELTRIPTTIKGCDNWIYSLGFHNGAEAQLSADQQVLDRIIAEHASSYQEWEKAARKAEQLIITEKNKEIEKLKAEINALQDEVDLESACIKGQRVQAEKLEAEKQQMIEFVQDYNRILSTEFDIKYGVDSGNLEDSFSDFLQAFKQKYGEMK